MNIKFILFAVILLVVAACQQQDITSFDECVAAGYEVMDSNPRQCRIGEEVFIEESKIQDFHVCTPEEKAAQACTLEYIPVCGNDLQTYGNGCSACASGDVEFYTYGACDRPIDQSEELIGGDTDDHGCLIAAGYRFDETVEACIRDWELSVSQAQAARKAVTYHGPEDGLTIIRVEDWDCDGCYQVLLQIDGEQFFYGIEDEQVKIK